MSKRSSAPWWFEVCIWAAVISMSASFGQWMQSRLVEEKLGRWIINSKTGVAEFHIGKEKDHEEER